MKAVARDSGWLGIQARKRGRRHRQRMRSPRASAPRDDRFGAGRGRRAGLERGWQDRRRGAGLAPAAGRGDPGHPAIAPLAHVPPPMLFRLASGAPCTDGTNGLRAFHLSLLDDPRIRLDQDWLGTRAPPALPGRALRLPRTGCCPRAPPGRDLTGPVDPAGSRSKPTHLHRRGDSSIPTSVARRPTAWAGQRVRTPRCGPLAMAQGAWIRVTGSSAGPRFVLRRSSTI